MDVPKEFYAGILLYRIMYCITFANHWFGTIAANENVHDNVCGLSLVWGRVQSSLGPLSCLESGVSECFKANVC